MFESVHEECGVYGIYEPERSDVASSVYFGLFSLQHRGQESCGIAVCDDGVIGCKKGEGLV
ncbi:MAG TPA: amidophosphoribosyltransferase, partial [Lachnospiraceae bacterium]|nr:amidophosphoribosyltransferase [Lachnospiraceae bacterium]